MPLLADASVDALAVDLPGHGESTEPLGDLFNHAAFVREVLQKVDGPVVLMGHSYGGAVITEAAAGLDHVQHLVYLCALVPDIEETVGSVMPGEVPPEAGVSDLGPVLRYNDDATMTVDASASVPVFYADCTDDDVAFALARLCPQNAASFGQPLTGAAWRDTPSTYVLCTSDRAINPAFQRAMSARTTTVVEWDTSHSPFFSRPDLVADLLISLSRT